MRAIKFFFRLFFSYKYGIYRDGFDSFLRNKKLSKRNRISYFIYHCVNHWKVTLEELTLFIKVKGNEDAFYDVLDTEAQEFFDWLNTKLKGLK